MGRRAEWDGVLSVCLFCILLPLKMREKLTFEKCFAVEQSQAQTVEILLFPLTDQANC